MKLAIFIGVWGVFTLIGWYGYKDNSSIKKMKIMNCRAVLKRYSKLEEMDKKSIL